jgi:hypothetical protein
LKVTVQVDWSGALSSRHLPLTAAHEQGRSPLAHAVDTGTTASAPPRAQRPSSASAAKVVQRIVVRVAFPLFQAVVDVAAMI